MQAGLHMSPEVEGTARTGPTTGGQQLCTTTWFRRRALFSNVGIWDIVGHCVETQTKPVMRDARDA